MVTGDVRRARPRRMGLEAFVRSQTLWDETMAESAVALSGKSGRRDKRLMVVAGGNHVSYGFGIPRRAFRRLPVSYVMIGGTRSMIPRRKKPEIMEVDCPTSR